MFKDPNEQLTYKEYVALAITFASVFIASMHSDSDQVWVIGVPVYIAIVAIQRGIYGHHR